MDIRNVTEFRNFVNINGLRGLHGDIDAVAICVMDYERGCNCWKNGDKQKIYNNCKALYVKSMGVVLGQFSAHFLAKTPGHSLTFFQDGVAIGSMRR